MLHALCCSTSRSYLDTWLSTVDGAFFEFIGKIFNSTTIFFSATATMDGPSIIRAYSRVEVGVGLVWSWLRSSCWRSWEATACFGGREAAVGKQRVWNVGGYKFVNRTTRQEQGKENNKAARVWTLPSCWLKLYSMDSSVQYTNVGIGELIVCISNTFAM